MKFKVFHFAHVINYLWTLEIWTVIQDFIDFFLVKGGCQNFIELFPGKGGGLPELRYSGGTFCHHATTKIQGG